MGPGLALSALLVACGGKAVIDGAAAGEGGSGGATNTSTHAGGQGSGPLATSLSDFTVVIGCKPGLVLPDPVQLSFTATYNNGSSTSASATISGAKVTLGAAPSTLDWSFELSPSSAGPVLGSGALLVSHTKGAGVDGSAPRGATPPGSRPAREEEASNAQPGARVTLGRLE